MRSVLLVLAILTLCGGSFLGCGLNGAAELQGKWIGTPDNAAAQAEREAAKYNELVAATNPADAAEETEQDGPRRPVMVTDWEHYDVTVTLEFLDARRVRLTAACDVAGSPVEGEWKIVESGPAGVVIEVITPGDATGEPDGETARPVRRRFELGLDRRESGLVGFTFNEVGADRRLGTLYFRRAE